MMKIKLLALKIGGEKESPDNPLTVFERDIDESQVTVGVWGNEYTTIHSWTMHENKLIAIRAVVKHVKGSPDIFDPMELKTVYWNPMSEVGGLARYHVPETINEI